MSEDLSHDPDPLGERGSSGARGDLTHDTLRGLFWTYSSIIVTIVLQIGYTTVVSRRLAPADFGLVALAGLPLALSTYFADMGIAAAVVQKTDIDNGDIRVALTGSVAAGVAVSVVVALLAAPLGHVLGNPAVVPILRVLALSFAISGFGSVAKALLRRQLGFRRIALVDVVSYTIGCPVVGLLLIFNGAGVWGLVAATLTQNAVSVVLSYALVRHSLRPLADRERARRIYGFGGLVSVNGLLEYLGASADTFAVGRFLGAAPLGQYSRANLVIGLPMNHLATGATRVLLPGLVRLQGDDARTRRVFLRGLALFAGLLFPVAGVLGVLSQPLVRVFLGDQWGQAARVLPIVGFATATGFVAHFPAVLFEAHGWMRRKILIQCQYLVTVVVLVVLVVHEGASLRRLACVFLAGQLLLEVLYLGHLKRSLAIRTADLLIPHLEGALLTAAAAAPAFAASRWFSDLPALVLGGIGGVVGWSMTVLLFKGLRARRALSELNLDRYLPGFVRGSGVELLGAAGADHGAPEAVVEAADRRAEYPLEDLPGGEPGPRSE